MGFNLGRHYLLVLIYAAPQGLELIPHCILYITTLMNGLENFSLVFASLGVSRIDIFLAVIAFWSFNEQH